MEVWHGDEFNEPISQLEQKDKSRLKRSEERERGDPFCYMHLKPKGQNDKRGGKPRAGEREQGHDKRKINLLRSYM